MEDPTEGLFLYFLYLEVAVSVCLFRLIFNPYLCMTVLKSATHINRHIPRYMNI